MADVDERGRADLGRHAPTGFDHEADGFSAVAATADGFIASGYHEESGQEQEPGLWRSSRRRRLEPRRKLRIWA